jgi:VIT1/CCC1 family predicted Fe2+/Mn2+ transporter
VTDLIGNEKLKSSATWLNTLSGATYTAGVALPLIAQVTGASHLEAGVLITLVGICFVLALVIHWGSHKLLGGLYDTHDQ